MSHDKQPGAGKRGSRGGRQRHQRGSHAQGRLHHPRRGNGRSGSHASRAAGAAAEPRLPAAERLIAVPPVAPVRLGSWRNLLIALVVVFLVAALGAFSPPGPWYETLSKPDWTPPNWLFGPAWTVLYVLVAIAGWLIFSHAPSRDTKILWGLQLAFNAAWSWLFFGQHLVGLALLDVALMALTTLTLIVVLLRDVYPWSRLAAILLVPYVLWISFATALNASIWLRNSF